MAVRVNRKIIFMQADSGTYSEYIIAQSLYAPKITLQYPTKSAVGCNGSKLEA